MGRKFNKTYKDNCPAGDGCHFNPVEVNTCSITDTISFKIKDDWVCMDIWTFGHLNKLLKIWIITLNQILTV